jgi:cytochrome c oxidase cbb3-type subunit 2
MSPIPKFSTFFGLIFAIFFFTWSALVVYPWLQLGQLQPIQEEGSSDITPWDSSGLAHQGERVYAANGCVYCHTQQVRPASSGADLVRGWGTAKDPDGKDVTRRSYPRDYIWQVQTFLGTSRNGADLSNVAERFPNAAALYSYLYDPYATNAHSSMPSYRFLFEQRRVYGQPSDDALLLPAADAPPPGYEIVPNAQAKSLVAYLLSLKKGYHLKPDEAGLPYTPPAATKS